ncbi:hypothetical protein [uncultured Tateyamaria sp.]|uniref:hypothetical protein n=1 Tax=uncultured Tateyamaria sp. TaxID=455651 RepID=UPI0026236947|nr:hypothetical protein [uncultured Tateyamaria sp.]
MKHAATVSVLVLSYAAIPSLPAHAQSTFDEVVSIVDSCDVLAAHPDDPMRVAPGVSDEELVPRLAVTACEGVLSNSDDVARHAFQLGRAYLALDQSDAAIDMFTQAADAGSAIAVMFLGDSYQFGWGGSVDAARSLELYERSRDMGLSIANIAIDQVQFDSTIFTTGAMLQWLVDRNIDAAKPYVGSPTARAYMYAFAVELADRCGSFLRPETVPSLQTYRFPPGWSAASEEGDQTLGIYDVNATYDVEVLTDRHGCNGFVVETIAASFNDLILAVVEDSQ